VPFCPSIIISLQIDVRHTWQFHSGLMTIGKTLSITGESETVANVKVYVFFLKTNRYDLYCYLFLLLFVQVDLIPFQTTNQQKTFAGPEILKSCYQFINPLSPTRRPKNKTKSSGAIPTLIFKACFSSLENNKIILY
jgi:hypothetical protein